MLLRRNDAPVVFAIGCPEDDNSTTVYSSTVYYPNELSKKENLINAKIHFQKTLALLEALVRKTPYYWFNFFDFWSAR